MLGGSRQCAADGQGYRRHQPGSPRGAGVIELIEKIWRAAMLASSRRPGTGFYAGADRDGEEAFLEPYRGSVLIAGCSGVGKSTLATALTERMAERKFEFCPIPKVTMASSKTRFRSAMPQLRRRSARSTSSPQGSRRRQHPGARCRREAAILCQAPSAYRGAPDQDLVVVAAADR